MCPKDLTQINLEYSSSMTNTYFFSHIGDANKSKDIHVKDFKVQFMDLWWIK